MADLIRTQDQANIGEALKGISGAKSARRPKTILVLGTGIGHGTAHIGVIEALEKENIKIDEIYGSSMGAVVGLLYSAGFTTKQMREIFMTTKTTELLQFPDMIEFHGASGFLPNCKLVTFKDGIFSGKKIEHKLRKLLSEKLGKAPDEIKVEDLEIPFYAVATQLATSTPRVFDKLNPIKAVRASFGLPGVFQSVKIDGIKYGDGGLMQRMPSNVAKRRQMEIGVEDYRIIVSDVGLRPDGKEPEGLLGVLGKAYTALEYNGVLRNELDADVVIWTDMNGLSPFSLKICNIAANRGRDAALDKMAEIRILFKDREF